MNFAKKISQISEGSIKLLVDRFYLKVRKEENLRSLFEDKIGTSEEDWRPHLETMYNFWSSLMLSSGKYKGSPMQKHHALAKFGEEKFEIWLKLFAETVNEIHTPEIAEKYIAMSENIAKSLRYGLYYNP